MATISSLIEVEGIYVSNHQNNSVEYSFVQQCIQHHLVPISSGYPDYLCYDPMDPTHPYFVTCRSADNFYLSYSQYVIFKLLTSAGLKCYIYHPTRQLELFTSPSDSFDYPSIEAEREQFIATPPVYPEHYHYGFQQSPSISQLDISIRQGRSVFIDGVKLNPVGDYAEKEFFAYCVQQGHYPFSRGWPDFLMLDFERQSFYFAECKPSLVSTLKSEQYLMLKLLYQAGFKCYKYGGGQLISFEPISDSIYYNDIERERKLEKKYQQQQSQTRNQSFEL